MIRESNIVICLRWQRLSPRGRVGVDGALVYLRKEKLDNSIRKTSPLRCVEIEVWEGGDILLRVFFAEDTCTESRFFLSAVRSSSQAFLALLEWKSGDYDSEYPGLLLNLCNIPSISASSASCL